ncbi:unnamed protein product [Schistosoma margrebowiei]|uniref:Uncharacterized protein n=1 Tax=Schistosoma margrebowiei TaxID=48269 RepID=A0A183MKL7_9TREM|nr:unnamed protein product [Schistosoma margrebowiei]
MQLDDLDSSDDLANLSHTQQQMQNRSTSVAAASFSTQNTSDPLARHYWQQPTVGENKADTSTSRNQKEALEVNKTHIQESNQLYHKASIHLESSSPKEKRKANEHFTSGTGDRHWKNGQKSDRTRKEGVGESGFENGGLRPMRHWKQQTVSAIPTPRGNSLSYVQNEKNDTAKSMQNQLSDFYHLIYRLVAFCLRKFNQSDDFYRGSKCVSNHFKYSTVN